MRKIHQTIFLSAVVLPLLTIAGPIHAQGISGECIHLPNDGDRLHPNVSFSKSAISDVDDERKCVSLNPELFAPSDDADVSVYVDSDTISYIQFATKQIFKKAPAAFEYLGYENRAGDFRLDIPAGVKSPDSDDRIPLSTEWKGRLNLHGREFLKKAEGTSSSSVENGWSIAGDTDTLRNATLVRWDLTLAYTGNDILNRNLTDTIAADSISDYVLPMERVTTERLLTRREMWFSEDARYPVLQRSRVFMLKDGKNEACDTTLLSSFSAYYPAAHQYSDTGDSDILNKPEGNGADHYTKSVDDGLNVSEATVGDSSISISIASKEGMREFHLTLYTDSGLRLSETHAIKAGAVPQTFSLAVPADYHGVAILLVESADQTVSRKIIL